MIVATAEIRSLDSKSFCTTFFKGSRGKLGYRNYLGIPQAGAAFVDDDIDHKN